MDSLRNYLQRANGDIFEVILRAIEMAQAEYPNELRARRDEIVEKLYTPQFQRRGGCHGVEIPVEERNDVVNDNSDSSFASEDIVGKECKGGSCSPNDHIGPKENNITHSEVEALEDILEEETQTTNEVLRIKEILQTRVDQSTSVLLESLRRLELMDVGMQTLVSTKIGNVVNTLKKHPIREISKLAQNLVRLWKTVISEWVATTEAAKSQGVNESPDSVNPSVNAEEECGLPSPPLDEGAFFTPETTSMELSKFFDGMDDLGDPNMDDKNGRKTNIRKENKIIQKRGSPFPREQNGLPKDNKNRLMTKQEAVIKQSHPSNTDPKFAKPSKPPGLEPKANHGVNLQQKLDTTKTERECVSVQLDVKSKPSEQLLDQKLEIAKRKLQQGYQQAENAKKQRTIQMMELQDLPKKGFNSNNKSSHVRPGSHNNRNWSNGRR